MIFIITGGAGFIGSAVIRHIINNTKHSAVNVDKLTYAGNLESLESIEDDARYAFEQVDICDANEIKRVFNKHQPDIVMHLAAESHVDRSIDGPGEFNHVKPASTLVSSSRGLGATTGKIQIRNNGKGIDLQWDPSECAVMPMLHNESFDNRILSRVLFSMKEIDDTVKFSSNIERFSLSIAAS